MSHEWKTKKEKILEYARKDPFLKIEDLAKRAETTPRYVRTILSEANVSLMQMRKDYARRMENKYSNVHDKLLFKYLLEVPFSSREGIKLQEELLFNSPQDFNLLPDNIFEDYNYQSYVHEIKGRPWSINSVILSKKLLGIGYPVNKGIQPEKMLDVLSQILKMEKINLSNIRLEIELSTGQLASFLKMSQLSPLMRVEQTIEHNGKPVILLLNYFNPKQVSLSLAIGKGLIINRKNFAG